MTETKTAWEQEYWAARRGVALSPFPPRGILRLTGADALDLLHRLSTQHLLSLHPGAGAATVLTNEKGRVLDLLTVLRFDTHLFVLTSHGNQGAVRAWIEKYTITEDVETVDVTESTAVLSLFGAHAANVVERGVGSTAASLAPYHHAPVSLDGVPATAVRLPAPVEPGYALIVDAASATNVRDALLKAGVVDMSPDTFEALRVEAGIPAFGHEFDERYNPLEARLKDHISWNKGCYIGQEVVARLDTYDKVQRHLRGLLFSPDSPIPAVETHVEAGGKEAGHVTSSAYSPSFKRPIALALVRRAYAAPETRLTVRTSPTIEVEVVDLPFAVAASTGS